MGDAPNLGRHGEKVPMRETNPVGRNDGTPADDPSDPCAGGRDPAATTTLPGGSDAAVEDPAAPFKPADRKLVIGGYSWDWWIKQGCYLYAFCPEIDDDDPRFLLPSWPVKIGITTDPRQRLESLRRDVRNGVWLEICWMDSGARSLERCLHELFSPWRFPNKVEWFDLPSDVQEWLGDGFRTSWVDFQKQERFLRCPIPLWYACQSILPGAYPGGWLRDRVKEMESRQQRLP